MALTSQQKHYIKKNINKLPVYQIASDLGLRQKQVEDFVKKRYGKDKLQKVSSGSGSRSIPAQEAPVIDENFRLSSFLADNINYFILFFVLVAICYFNSLGNAFVSDDIATIAKNPNIGSPNLALNSSLLTDIFYVIVYKIGGANPTYFRMANIFFHFIAVCSVFSIISLIGKKRIAIIASLIYAVHPLLIEGVGWIAGGPYARSGAMFFLSFLFYILAKSNKRYYYFSWAALLLAMLFSEKTIPLFLAFPLYELTTGGLNLKNNWKKLLPYFIIAALSSSLILQQAGDRLHALNTQYYEDATGYMNPMYQVPIAITSYIGLLFWPDKLSLYHTELTFTKAQYFLRLVEFIAFLGLILYGWIKNKKIFFWLTFFMISLAVTLTPVKVAWVVAERYSYIGSFGVIVVFAIFFDWLMEKSDKKYLTVFYSVMALIVISLSVRTIVRNVDWKNEDNLWIATAKVAPSGAPIHNNMGDVYARHGDYQKAIEEFTTATQINPRNADAVHNLANTYQMMGDRDNAQKYYEKALSLNPNIWQSCQNLAAIYYEKGEVQKATEYIKRAIEINPTNEDLKKNLQIIESQQGVSPGNQ